MFNRSLFLLLFTALITVPDLSFAELLDKVIISVDDQPITLSDFNSYTNDQYNLKSLSEDKYNSDTKYKKAVEQLIHFKLLDLEAKKLNVKVTDEEINGYIGNLASQNSLSIDKFKEVLANEGKSLDALKQQVKYQSLQSKLVRKSLKGKVEPSSEEIDQAIRARHGENTRGSFVEIRKVIIDSNNVPEKVLVERIEKIKDSINSGTPFSDIVKAYSDDEDDSSTLTRISDLNDKLKNALQGIPEGGLAEPVLIDGKITLAQVIRKVDGDLIKERSIRDIIKKELRTFKVQKMLEKFVTEELPSNHIVKRIFDK